MGMPPLIFDIGLFDPLIPGTRTSEDEVLVSEEIMLLATHFLGKINQLFYRLYPQLPHIYLAGLPYHHDWGREWFWSLVRALKVGHADCKVWLAWLLACKWAVGIDARPFITSRMLEGRHQGTRMYHYRVHCPWSSLAIDTPPFLDTPAGPTVEPSPNPDEPGIIEDPSRVLGHGWELGYATTNRKPRTPEFRERLTELLGRPPRDVFGTLVPPPEHAHEVLAGALQQRARLRLIAGGAAPLSDCTRYQTRPSWMREVA